MADPPDGTSDSSRPLLSRVLIWGGGILAGLFVLILVAALLLPQFFTSEELKGYVIPPMEEATGRQVEIDDIGLRVLWTPAVSVSGFRLANREGFGPEPAVEAAALNVELALWPLFRGSVEPSAIELVDPVIRYEIAEDSTSNFDDLMAPDTTEAQTEESGLTIPVSNFHTTGAQMRYNDRSTGQAAALYFDAQLNALPDGDAVTSVGSVTVDSVQALLPDIAEDTMTVTSAQIDYDVRAALSEGRVDVSTLTIDTAPVMTSVSGTILQLDTRPTVDLTIETTEADLAQLSAFVPAVSRQLSGLNPTGSAQLTARVQGSLPDSTGTMDDLSVDGTGQLSSVGFDYEDTAMLRNLQADLAVSLESAALRSIEGELLGASLTGNVAVQDPFGEPAVDLDLETGEMNLGDLAAFASPETVESYNPQGTLQLDLTATGPIPDSSESLDQITLDGTGRLADVGVDYEGAAMLRDLRGDLAFSGSSVAVRSIDGQLLGRDLTGDVTIEDPMGSPTVDGHLAGAADLAELSSLASDTTATAEESVSGIADYDVRFSGPADDPDAIRPEGRVDLTDVQYPYESFRHPIELPEATVQLTGTGLSMDPFTIRTGEQEMRLQTTVRNLFPISKGLSETNPAMVVDFTLTSDRLDLVELYPEEDTSEVSYSQLFAANLSGSEVNGQSPEATAQELYGDVELPSYAVDGQVNIATFLNDPQRIDDLSFDLQMRNRRLDVRDLSGTTYEGTLAGSLTFDQSESASTSSIPSGSEESVLIASSETAVAPRGPTPPSSDLSYNFELTEAQASAFLDDWTTLGRVVDGTLDLQMDGTTPLSEGMLPLADALTAKGTSIVADGGLSLDLGVTKQLVEKLGLDGSTLTKFQRFGGPFMIEDGALQLGTWKMGGQGPDARLTGTLGLGGSVDLNMRMDLPLSALQNSNIPGLVGSDDKIAGLVQKLAGGDQGDTTIPVEVTIGGTMRNPTVEVIDKESVRSAIQKLVKEEGLDRVRDLFDGG